MIRMSKDLNRGVDYKVRNRAADKEFINSGAHERIIIRIPTSPDKTPFVLMTNPPNIDKVMLRVQSSQNRNGRLSSVWLPTQLVQAWICYTIEVPPPIMFSQS